MLCISHVYTSMVTFSVGRSKCSLIAYTIIVHSVQYYRTLSAVVLHASKRGLTLVGLVVVFSTMADSVSKKFHPPKSFSFPKRSFGSKKIQRSFRSELCQEFNWLHYDATDDTAYCHLCLCTEAEKRFLASTKREPAFISRGYINWKDARTAFNAHSLSTCHKEAVQSLKLSTETGYVAEVLSTAHGAEKALNRMLRRILQNIRFLARQGLSLRGGGDGEDSNFTQLLRLRAFDCPDVAA